MIFGQISYQLRLLCEHTQLARFVFMAMPVVLIIYYYVVGLEHNERLRHLLRDIRLLRSFISFRFPLELLHFEMHADEGQHLWWHRGAQGQDARSGKAQPVSNRVPGSR